MTEIRGVFVVHFINKCILTVNFCCQQISCPYFLVVTGIPEPLRFFRQYGQGAAAVSQHLISHGRIDAGTVHTQIIQSIRGKLKRFFVIANRLFYFASEKLNCAKIPFKPTQPKDNLTRAEAAAIVQRLLKTQNLFRLYSHISLCYIQIASDCLRCYN